MLFHTILSRHFVGNTRHSANTSLTHHNTGALVVEQAGKGTQSAEQSEGGHHTVEVCEGPAPATNKSGHGETAAAMSSIRRLVGQVGLEPTT
ncbi:hypothetical protein [Saccharopolyspora rosea]|uniref:Uncharacterized protein n=1 Tax=Saccharopolyspora rosea TaxID=524884 RepID=A0ABW3FV88_9PSEU|nr:hypothetical protein [Saccharopolyspora rosea]